MEDSTQCSLLEVGSEIDEKTRMNGRVTGGGEKKSEGGWGMELIKDKGREILSRGSEKHDGELRRRNPLSASQLG